MFRPLAAAAVSASLLFAAAPTPAEAGPYADSLSRCLLKSATEEDKTALMVWIFAAIAQHPAAKGYTNMTDAQREDIARDAAGVFMRLISVDCRREAVAALGNEQNGFEIAFRTLGESAAGDLLGGGAPAREMERLMEYVDKDELTQMGVEAALGRVRPRT